LCLRGFCFRMNHSHLYIQSKIGITNLNIYSSSYLSQNGACFWRFDWYDNVIPRGRKYSGEKDNNDIQMDITILRY
jgi:hypothetical protein